jgi:hypothetical protein
MVEDNPEFDPFENVYNSLLVTLYGLGLCGRRKKARGALEAPGV